MVTGRDHVVILTAGPPAAPGPSPAEMAAIREAAHVPGGLGPGASSLIRHAWAYGWAAAAQAHKVTAVYVLPGPEQAGDFATWAHAALGQRARIVAASCPLGELLATALLVDAEIVDDGEEAPGV